MKKPGILLLLLLFGLFGSGQKVYFIYLQSENQQPFFARMDEKIYSSTASGYLILSKLRDTSYNIHIGFPGNQSGDRQFKIHLHRKDHGYLLKDFGEKGWGLFDLQTLAVQMPEQNASTSMIKTEKRESNAFTDLLAKAADDSTLKERPVLVKNEKQKEKEEVKKPEEKKPETVVIVADTKTQAIVPPETVVEKPVVEIKKEEEKKEIGEPASEVAYQKSTIVRRSESSTTEGFGIVFIDNYPGGVSDTIRIIIPNNPKMKELVEEKKTEPAIIETVSRDSMIAEKEKEKVKEKVEEIVTPLENMPRMNACKAKASDDDFYKLRKKMASGKSDDYMIAEAKKVFRTKCFTVQHIKNLSALFLGDEGKYNFFDLSYPYVSDLENFSTLQSQLKEEYYVNRFKAMLR